MSRECLVSDELGDSCSLSRRFGVVQSLAGRRKVRPSDNFSESLVNSTTSRVESIQPHGIDVVCTALAYRLRARDRAGQPTVPRIKTTDLHQAYKQLGLSTDAVQDTFLSMPNPEMEYASVYECRV